jgi:2-dehydropantoate 2-reductase
LRIGGLGEEEILTPQLVTAAELSGTYDVLLVSVKASGLEQALDDAAPAVGPRTAVIPFLNGMAHLDTLNARFGKESVLGGVVKVATTVNENGDIVRLAPLSSFAFGEQNGQPPPRTRDLSALLDVEGYALSVPPDIVAAMWHNWVFIAGVGAVTCLMRGTVGDVVAVEGGADWQHDHAQACPANHDMKPCDLVTTVFRVSLLGQGGPCGAARRHALCPGRARAGRAAGAGPHALVTPLRSLVHDAIHLFGVRRLPVVTGVDQRR